MDKRDDRELIKRCIGGDAWAWSKFVDKFSGLIYWIIKRKLSKHNCTYLMSEVEDIYQRIFTSIWEKKSLIGVCERDNISPWLVVLASNLTIDFLRRKKVEENFLRDTSGLEGALRAEKTDMLDMESEYLLNKRLLVEAMGLLNEKEKTCLELNYIAGKRHREIAEIFNTSTNSVSTTIARAKNKIKKYIESKNKM